MEPRSQGKRAQGTLGFRSSKKLLQQQQRGLTGDGKKRHLPAELKGIVHQTWPPAHGTEKRVKERLPEKLMLLEEMYHSMEAAISLLRMRHSMCTFSTIAAAVESSTQRRFLRSHLAQIKHILPEALQVEEHISWDVESQCSRRDLRITLLPISSEEGGSLQRYKSPQKSTDMVLRRQEFHSRLLQFHQKNKEIDIDVPQASMFDGVTSSCLGAGNVKSPEPSRPNFEDLQEEREVYETNEQAKASRLDCVQVLNKNDECETSPLPVAFNMSQLKKYPRSPSKLPHQHRISPVPLHASMSHLPPVFKPHFSAKRQADLADLDRNKSSDKALELEPLHASMPHLPPVFKPHFSAKRQADLADLDRNKSSEKALELVSGLRSIAAIKRRKQAVIKSLTFGTPTKHGGDGKAMPDSTDVKEATVTAFSDAFMSPIKTPANDTFVSRGFNEATVTAFSDAFMCPIKTPANDTSIVSKKPAVIKSLRFGTPTKHGGHGKAMLDSTDVKEATVTAFSDAFMSPIKTPANDTFVSRGFNVATVTASSDAFIKTPANDTFVDSKKPAGNVRRVLPFNSPVGGADKLSTSDVEILKCLPQELLNDVQAKERKQLQDVQSGLEQARRRQQLIAGLPKLFNMVRLLFQSGNRTVLTRKDLVKMVLSSHPDITDQGEIMEQLQLLVDFAPEWISTNRSLAGDLLYRINKNANMRAVSKALVEAK